MVTMNGEPPRLGHESEVDSEYTDPEELNSCFLIDEDESGPIKPRYSEFNMEFDMKNLQLKIGMKFRSFKEFKEAVNNFAIRNRYVMNFKPNSRKRCNAFCKRRCPFYL